MHRPAAVQGCFFAGANSVFYGDKLLTTPNPDENTDLALFAKLGMNTAQPAPAAATLQ